jgi:hypothetical protein
MAPLACAAALASYSSHASCGYGEPLDASSPSQLEDPFSSRISFARDQKVRDTSRKPYKNGLVPVKFCVLITDGFPSGQPWDCLPDFTAALDRFCPT